MGSGTDRTGVPPAVAGARPRAIRPPNAAFRPALRWQAGAIVVVVLLAAAWVRFFRLGAEGFWLDEAWTALLVRQPPGRLLDLLRADDAPPLFYLLQSLMRVLVGGTEGGLRLLSALSGFAAVLVAWRLCRVRAPHATIPVVAALGFSTVAVHYSRQARSYALLHLLALVVLGASLSLRERPGRRTAAWFLLSCLGLAYCHNLGILLVAAGVLTGVVPLLWNHTHRRTGLLVAGLLTLGMIPWLVAVVPQLGVHDAGNAWMGFWWKGRGGVFLGPFVTPLALANGTAAALHTTVPLPALPASAPLLRWFSWGIMGVGIAGVALALRNGTRAIATRRAGTDPALVDRDRRGRSLLLGALVFTVTPLVGLVAISLLAGPAYVVGRTDTLALPGIALLLGIGWTWGPRVLAPIAASAWIVLGFISLAPSWSTDADSAKGSDRTLATLLGGEIAPGDAVVFTSLSRPSIEYYGRRQGWWDRAGWTGSFPVAFDRNAATPWPAPLDSAAAWQRQAMALRAAWEERGAGTVWVLAVLDPATTEPGGNRAAQEGWPRRPAPPPPAQPRLTAQAVSYPENLLVSTLAGLRPVEARWEYRQDWISGRRLVLRLPRATWVPLDSIPRLETRP